MRSGILVKNYTGNSSKQINVGNPVPAEKLFNSVPGVYAETVPQQLRESSGIDLTQPYKKYNEASRPLFDGIGAQGISVTTLAADSPLLFDTGGKKSITGYWFCSESIAVDEIAKKSLSAPIFVVVYYQATTEAKTEYAPVTFVKHYYGSVKNSGVVNTAAATDTLIKTDCNGTLLGISPFILDIPVFDFEKIQVLILHPTWDASSLPTWTGVHRLFLAR